MNRTRLISTYIRVAFVDRCCTEINQLGEHLLQFRDRRICIDGHYEIACFWVYFYHVVLIFIDIRSKANLKDFRHPSSNGSFFVNFNREARLGGRKYMHSLWYRWLVDDLHQRSLHFPQLVAIELHFDRLELNVWIACCFFKLIYITFQFTRC